MKQVESSISEEMKLKPQSSCSERHCLDFFLFVCIEVSDDDNDIIKNGATLNTVLYYQLNVKELTFFLTWSLKI